MGKALVGFLGGHLSEWERLWLTAEQRQQEIDAHDRIEPLPWVDEDDDDLHNADHAVGDWIGRHGMSRGLLRRLAVASTGVLVVIVGFSIYLSVLRPLLQPWVAAASLCIVILTGVAWWWHGRRNLNTTERRRQVMLKKVRNHADEITKLAETGSYLTPRFTILIGPLVSDPGRARRRKAPTPPPPIRERFAEGDVGKLHERAGEELVLLANAGLGKTTQMAVLAHRLATYALDKLDDRSPSGEDDSRPPPIPVLLSLSSYRGEPLQEWLVTETSQVYGVAKKRVVAWLNEDLLLPLLDGLDQVPTPHRRECASQIRRFRERSSGIVVSCRSRDYHLARTINAALYAEIDRPDRHDVQTYLTTNADAMADVRAALEADESLWALLRSPLMLNIIHDTYDGGRPATELRRPGTLRERQDRVFDAYVHRMLASRPTPYTPRQTVVWLTWLARTLTTRAEDVLYVDRLQPNVLASPVTQQSVLRAIIPARILISLILAFGWLFSSGLPISGMLVIAVLVAAIGGHIFTGISAIRKEAVGEAIKPIDRIDWNLSPQRLILAGLAAAAAFVAVATWIWPYVGWELRLLGGGAASFTTAGAIIMGEPYAGAEPVRPNQQIRRCGMNTLILLLGVLIIPVVTAPILVALLPASTSWLGQAGTLFMITLTAGIACGMLPWPILNFGGTAFVRHWVMRWQLRREGSAPLRYVRFLHDAEGRALLRRTGSGFTFPHKILQGHLNTRPNELLQRLGLEDTEHPVLAEI